MENFEERWMSVETMLLERFGKVPDMEGILFLIGMNEHGQPPRRAKFSKEEKQDLMHIGVCTLLSQYGYYAFSGRDGDGWPHFELVETPPALAMPEQERMLKECIVNYFEQ
jgi:hypothetical protein